MKRILKKVVSQKNINRFYHLPVAVVANLQNGFPGKKMKVIGVTGTDGKTTTTNMIYFLLRDAGKKVAMVSTINAKIGDKNIDTGFHVTSPDPPLIQMLLKKALNAGTEYMVLEATSNALDQYRYFGIPFEIGVVTNITHEHLDYHKTFENYRAAKAKLLKGVRFAILNKDDKNFGYLSKKTSGKIVSYGLKSGDLNLKNNPLRLKIPGDYNLSNALAASAVGEILGIDKKIIQKSLENFRGLSGRMEEIPNKKGIKIIVDFAHTPNGLENALKTLKQETKGKLISVFGSASERDLEKRPLMGEISASLSDVTVLTDEDPRFENRDKIIDEIAAGYHIVKKDNLYREPDRQKAIALAISLAKKGDTVGIFGKGHEKSMNYKGVEKPWSDKLAVQKVLNG